MKQHVLFGLLVCSLSVVTPVFAAEAEMPPEPQAQSTAKPPSLDYRVPQSNIMVDNQPVRSVETARHTSPNIPSWQSNSNPVPVYTGKKPLIKSLTGQDFSGQNLRTANFKHNALSGANFSRAILVEAKFQGADVSGANFYRATLMGANFRKANLYGADLRNADLSNIITSGANFWNARYNKGTTFPPNFVPAQQGLIFEP